MVRHDVGKCFGNNPEVKNESLRTSLAIGRDSAFGDNNLLINRAACAFIPVGIVYWLLLIRE